MSKVAVGDRVLFSHGVIVREGIVEEISSSGSYVKLRNFSLGITLENWQKLEDLLEVLESRSGKG